MALYFPPAAAGLRARFAATGLLRVVRFGEFFVFIRHQVVRKTNVRLYQGV